MNVSLLNQKMTDILFMSNLGDENKTIQVGIKYDFEVLHSDVNVNSRAKIKYYVEDLEKPSSFQLTIGFEGILEHDPIQSSDDKIEIHMKAYEMLFPYVQMVVSQTAGFAGLSPLMIPKDKMIKESIAFIDNYSRS